jgi:hypothetical protein
MKKGVVALTKAIRKNREQGGKADPQAVQPQFGPDGALDFPDYLWFAEGPPKVFHLLTLHPAEIARQLTLIESNIFRLVVLVNKIKGLLTTLYYIF